MTENQQRYTYNFGLKTGGLDGSDNCEVAATERTYNQFFKDYIQSIVYRGEGVRSNIFCTRYTRERLIVLAWPLIIPQSFS